MLSGPLLSIFLLVAVALLVTAGLLVGTTFLGPRRQTPVKQMPYESGKDTVGDARGRFDVRFHLISILFLIFYVELLFLYPWAVAAWDAEHGLAAGTAATGTSLSWILGEMIVFIVLLGLAYVYAWRRGVFRWRA